MGMGVVSSTSNIDSQLSELFAYPNTWILELAKGVQIIEVGLYNTIQRKFQGDWIFTPC